MEGTVINDRYKAVRELKPPRDGKIYWLVEDQDKGNELKMLKGIGLFEEKMKQEAKLEVDLLQRLDHPNVVKLHDNFSFSAHNNLPYHGLILEYLPGGDLGQFIEKKLENEGGENEEEWVENDALGICAQIVLAMNYLHGENIIHRDIKPENILLSGDKKEIKIADFNVSRLTDGTMNTGMAGSMEYLPPESIQAQGNENVTFGHDVWAMGIVFQMLCTFRHPFATGNFLQTMLNISQNLRNPAEVVFPAMESLIQECLKIDLGERAANAAALMNHRSIVSLIKQLQNRIQPKDLVFGKNRVETTEVINEHLNQENLEKSGEIENLKRENKELKKKNKSLEEKIKTSLIIEKGEFENIWKIGFGFYTGLDSYDVRYAHKENDIRRVLRAMAAGFTEFNLKFVCDKNLEVTEAEWTIRHQMFSKIYDGDGFWKLWLSFKGKRVDFQADADDIGSGDGKSYNSAKKLTPDSNGMVKLKGGFTFVRWNITILK